MSDPHHPPVAPAVAPAETDAPALSPGKGREAGEEESQQVADALVALLDLATATPEQLQEAYLANKRRQEEIEIFLGAQKPKEAPSVQGQE